MVNVTEVASVMEGELSCYIVGQFNGGTMVMLQRRREWSCYRTGHFNGQRMVMLRRWPA